MKISVTGAPGFLGRYIVNHLTDEGLECRCWRRLTSDCEGFNDPSLIDWIPGELNDSDSSQALVSGADVVVHGAVDWDRGRGIAQFAEKNVVGTLRLMELAADAGVERFIFIASCAVHEVILDDRNLDETHPLWPTSPYGAYKAAVEKFVHSYGFGQGWGVCSLRPTGIYGVRRPIERSKWFDLVRDVAEGKPVRSRAGGKEVHAADCAKAVGVLLKAPIEKIKGEAFSCYDMYISDEDVAAIAKGASGSDAEIGQLNQGCKHQIDTSKIRNLGMEFGGRPLLEKTVKELLAAVG
jgi:nucleoside-diphosphate-sugar epimerase